MESKKYSLNVADLETIGKGALIALAGAMLAYASQVLTQIDFGLYTPIVVALLSIAINAGRKFVTS